MFLWPYIIVCILIVVYVFLDAATLTEVFPCFFLGCKANARVKLAKTGHGPHSSKIVMLFYVLFVLYRSMYCLCVNVYCTAATGWQPQLQLTNISNTLVTNSTRERRTGKSIRVVINVFFRVGRMIGTGAGLPARTSVKYGTKYTTAEW